MSRAQVSLFFSRFVATRAKMRRLFPERFSTMSRTGAHLHHHGRFYAALAIGAAIYVVAAAAGCVYPFSAGGDAFFLAYLAAGAWMLGSTHEDLRRRAAIEDEGIFIVVIITLAAIAATLTGIFIALDHRKGTDPLSLVLALSGAPLGWLMLHTVSAFHYANLHYFEGGSDNGRALDFPGTDTPGPWDFLYFSFVIGMTAQVSDVQVRTVKMRRAVLGHSAVSFLYNTVLIALAVNAAIAAG
jgi:uncharacterized membrane protein